MNKEILEKIAEFSDLAISEISSLQHKISKLEKAAQAQEEQKELFEDFVKKAADALYESDFLTDRHERKDFIKKASEDPSCLARTIEKLCAYKDVTGLGKTSSVRSCKPEEADPIMIRAFGYSGSNNNLLDD